MISRLVRDYENGKVSRRELIRTLTLAAVAAAPSPRSASAAASRGFETAALDHISYQVSDYRKTRDFYADLMGMAVSDDNGSTQCQLHFGDSLLIARNHRTKAGEPPAASPKPVVDHIAYKIRDWDTDGVKAELLGRGLAPRLDTGGGDGYASFHVLDPDGYDLQISGDVKPGDSLYKKKG